MSGQNKKDVKRKNKDVKKFDEGSFTEVKTRIFNLDEKGKRGKGKTIKDSKS